MTQPTEHDRRHHTGRLLRWTAIGLVPLALAACSNDVRESFGLGRRSPDEFMVVSRAPLSLPPDYSLRPPQPGVSRPQEGTARDRAQEAVFGVTQAPSTAADFEAAGMSPGTSELLANAGASHITPNIRQMVDEESTQLAQADEHFIDRLFFWQDQPEPGEVVDPAAERQRLATAVATGQPVNEGEVPTIERRRRAPLEGILHIFD